MNTTPTLLATLIALAVVLVLIKLPRDPQL
jgi:hypothetical protein